MYDDVTAFCAHDAVPNNDPVIPAVTLREPVIIELLSAMTPLRATNSFGICYTLVHFP
mgnify:CR=1 FL=1